MKSLRARITTILSAQLTMVILGLLCIVTLFELSQIAYKRYETEREIANYEKDIARLQNEQAELKSLLEFLNTDYFAEREARVKLGLQKPGEQVVIVSKPEMVVSTESEEEGEQVSGGEQPILSALAGGVPAEAEQKKNNPAKWGDYFFGETE